MTLSQRRERTRAEQGFGGLSLVELYEERSHFSFRASQSTYLTTLTKYHAAGKVMEIDRLILAHLKNDVIIGPWELENPRLLHGVPDAARAYKAKRYPPETAFSWGASYLETKS